MRLRSCPSMSWVRCLHTLWWSQLSAQWHGWLYNHIHPTSHHPPPQSIRIAVEISFPARPNSILLAEIHEVARKYQPKEPNIEGGDQLLTEYGLRSISVSLPDDGDKLLIQAVARCHLGGQHAACVISKAWSFRRKENRSIQTNLEEPDTSYSRSSEDLPIGTKAEDQQRSRHNCQIWKISW